MWKKSPSRTSKVKKVKQKPKRRKSVFQLFFWRSFECLTKQIWGCILKFINGLNQGTDQVSVNVTSGSYLCCTANHANHNLLRNRSKNFELSSKYFPEAFQRFECLKDKTEQNIISIEGSHDVRAVRITMISLVFGLVQDICLLSVYLQRQIQSKTY